MNKAEELNKQLAEWKTKQFETDLEHLHGKAIDRINGAIQYKHSERTTIAFWYDSYQHTQDLAEKLAEYLKQEGFFTKWSTSPDDSVQMDISTIPFKTVPSMWQSLKMSLLGKFAKSETANGTEDQHDN